jgi:hypothetical protein
MKDCQGQKQNKKFTRGKYGLKLKIYMESYQMQIWSIIRGKSVLCGGNLG